MPKGMMKELVDVGEYHWFYCKCGYRYTASSQSAKSMAVRLHQKKCEIAHEYKLTNMAFRPIKTHLEAKDHVSEEIVNSMKPRSPTAFAL